METLGYIAGLVTLAGFMPQTLKTIRTRETGDLSLATFVLLDMSATLWVIYGLANAKPAIWLTNCVVGVCSLIVVILKIKHG